MNLDDVPVPTEPRAREGRVGLSRATGRPRFVITISRPVSATSSISHKLFALNSVAVIVHSPVALSPSADTSKPSRACRPRSPHRRALPSNRSAIRPLPSTCSQQHSYLPSRSPRSASHTMRRGPLRSRRISVFPRSLLNSVFGRSRYGTSRATGRPASLSQSPAPSPPPHPSAPGTSS